MKNQKHFQQSLLRCAMYLSIFLLNTSFASSKKDSENNTLKFSDLKCEYSTNPIRMDILSPQLSWKIESEKRGIVQSAYQIIVADSPESLTKNIANIWDSGTIASSKSTGISYSGSELKSRKRYYWKVRIWDSNNTISDWSESAFFEMGLLNQEDWKADWIGYPASWTGRVLYFRRTFSTTKVVQKARVYPSDGKDKGIETQILYAQIGQLKVENDWLKKKLQ